MPHTRIEYQRIAHNPCLRIIHLQRPHQHPQRMPLPLRPGILCHSVAIQTTLIAYPDTMSIVALCVGTNPLDRACGSDITIPPNVKMIADAIKAAEAVSGVQILLGKGTVLASGTTMNDN